MYFKLAIRNLKKSLKDYTIYFLTLVFGVCIFYTFNSIQSQSIMMELSDVKANMFEVTSDIIGVASVFISFILGFLIVYANNYLIKRRKKEFGIYMTLGMDNRKLSTIIFIETMLVGIISLVIGLIFGILLSQGISIFTANLFEVNITKFQFVFSKKAFLKTIENFGIIYLVVLVFNSINIRCVKLIDLLNASKKNEKLKVKNIWVSIVVFLISVVSIITAYHIVLKNGLAIIDITICRAIILGIVGTFLFFFSLSGFFLKVFQSNKKTYLKNLNMFVLRQINSKINTTFISMSFICLMLFVAICTFSAGLGITKAINSDIEDLTQFDASFWSYDTDNVLNTINEDYYRLDEIIGEKSQYTDYESDYTYKKFFDEEVVEKNKNLYQIAQDRPISIIKLSDFNELMKMLNKEEIVLREDEYYAFGDISEVIKDIQESMNNGVVVDINNRKLVPANYKVMNVTIYNSMMKNNICTIVVNDEIVIGLKPVFCNLNINFKGDIKEAEKYLNENFRTQDREDKAQVYGLTKNELFDNSVGVGAMISYLAIYMGIVFVITSAAVLTLQQLSESADNIYRYEMLKKVGVDNDMINKALFTQIGIYFIVPLSLAIVHSIVGLDVASDLVSIFGSGNIQYYILFTTIVLVIVYGGYFIATYNGAKKMLK